MRTCGTTMGMGGGLATFGPNLDTGVSCSEEEVQKMKIIIGILNGYFYTCNLTCIGESTLS